MKPKFTTFRGTNLQYYFNLKAGNGEKILSSEGYHTESGRNAGIESVKINAPYDFRYTKRVSSNGLPYFTLHGANGEIIGTSETYVTISGRDNGIESVKTNAPIATVE